MATTIIIASKTPTSISGTTTKSVSYTTYTAIGPGFDYDTIYQNRIDRATASGAAGTYNWSFSSGLYPNTQYGVVAFAVGGGDSEVSAVHDGTLPPPALSSASVGNVTTTTATISYTTAADGGYYTKTIQYSLDNGTTWNNAGTVGSGSATSGSFPLTGLTAETSYTVLLRTTTTAGSSSTTTVSFTTAEAPKVIKSYGSVSGSAVLLTDSYGSSSSQAQRITKLYGAANGQTKLIHQGFGHIDYGYGVVTYYTDSGHTTTDSVIIASQTEFNQLRSLTSDSWSATIGGRTIPNTDILGLILTNKVTTIPTGFLRGCTAFNSNLVLPPTITAIGSSSGADFMRVCTNMVSTVDFGSLPTSIVSTTDSNSFTTGTDGTAPAYTSGIKIAGSNRSAWLSFYPNRSHTPYRKLVDAGY